MTTRRLPRTALTLGLLAIAAVVAFPALVHTAETPTTPASSHGEKGVSPGADGMLRRMTDYLASLQSFTVESSSVDEVVLKTGQKIQLVNDSLVSVKRPNRLRSEQVGSVNGMAFWYDGKTMSLYCRASSTYGTAPAPPTLDAMIDAARKQFQIEAPGADLLFSHPYEVLTEQVTGGQIVGRETVDGVPTNHLAFVGQDVDWQVWIQDSPRPLPLRFVITTKTMKEQPEFTVRLSHWEPQATLADATFAFQPPPGSKRVDSLPASCAASP
jgi:hypothetical protein